MALLLFDIDGTLCRSLGFGRRAFEAALAELFGPFPQERRFAYDGLLDTQIARLSLEPMGISPDAQNVGRLLAKYVEILSRNPPERPSDHLCPGIPSSLEALRQAGNSLALLTGNVRAGAAVKLGFFGLTGFFRDGAELPGLLGAFGEDASERYELVPLAVQRCSRFYDRPFSAGETWLVGDSIRDVEAARRGGVRCAAVATGLTDMETLGAERPDLLLEDLASPAPLLAALGRGGSK